MIIAGEVAMQIMTFQQVITSYTQKDPGKGSIIMQMAQNLQPMI